VRPESCRGPQSACYWRSLSRWAVSGTNAYPKNMDELEDLHRKRALLQDSLDTSTKAWKKCRQMRGADAFKRAWYFEEQIEKKKAQLAELDAKIDAISS
jgi:hypothetical protein